MLTPESTNPERYPCLDGIRGLAVLFVLTAHISNRKGMLFSGGGEFGVWLFFVLSAFLLSLYFFQRPERITRPIEWGNYGFRRFLRIYPLYIAALVFGFYDRRWSTEDLINSILLKKPTYWAVFVEFRFYFLLPLIVVVFEYSGRFSKLIPSLLMITAIIVHYRIFPDGSTVLGYERVGLGILFWEYLIVFVMGAFTAWAYVNTPRVRKSLSDYYVADAIALLALAATLCSLPGVVGQLVLIWSHLFPNATIELVLDPGYYHFQWVPWSAVFAVLIYMTMAAKGPVKSLFESKALRFFGMVSYSMYLSMDFIIPRLKFLTDDIFFLTVAVALVSFVSFVLFTLVERPLSKVSLVRKRSIIATVPMDHETHLNIVG